MHIQNYYSVQSHEAMGDIAIQGVALVEVGATELLTRKEYSSHKQCLLKISEAACPGTIGHLYNPSLHQNQRRLIAFRHTS